MTNLSKFPSFMPCYKALEENKHSPFSIEMYHHDSPSEPTVFIAEVPREIRLDRLDEYGMIIEIHLTNTCLVFTERNHNTNLSNDSVVFSSKYDDETYWIIEIM